MRLLFVADLHYSLKQFDWLLEQAPKFDATAIGGDLLDLSSPLEADVQIAVVEKYLVRLRQKGRVLVCSGNHDGDSRNAADESVAAWLQAARADDILVDGEGVTIDGARITICPWWDGDQSRGELERFLAGEAQLKPADGRWVWLYHAPPTGSRTSWTGRKFIGDDALRGWIERFQPDAVLGGHIHNSPFYQEGSWIDRVGRTWVFNPGRQIGPRPTTIVLDLGAMTAEWTSQEGTAVNALGADAA